ncbi:polysaccharide deacetylase family protein [Salinicoccus siamensis]|uniref:polysaccharide deacetylase family protein n=1 Tax=Salinicoccus siamensis TaxID=381830 RepID=UPI00361E1E46
MKKLMYLITIIIILGACQSPEKMEQNTSSVKGSQGEENNPEKTEQKESKSIEESNYPGIDIITEIEDTETLNASTQYPETAVDSIDDAIKQYIEAERNHFNKQLEDFEVPPSGQEAIFNLSYETERINDNLYTFDFTTYMFTYGANGETRKNIMMADVKDQEIIEGQDIFDDTAENRKLFYDYILEYAEEDEDLSLYLFEDELKKWIEAPDNDFNNLYITKEGLGLSFNEYEIAAGAAGSIEVKIPFDQAQNLVKEEYTRFLETSNVDDGAQEQRDTEAEVYTERAIDQQTKKVALTFDDGPHPEHTLNILDTLDEYDAKATFFMQGKRIEYYMDVAKEVAERGHEIGNHSMNHPDFTTLSFKQIDIEVSRTNQLIMQATGLKPTVFRPPYGSTNEEINNFIDMEPVLWTIDTEDWKNKDPNIIEKRIRVNMHDDAIILMHDIHGTTAQALPDILEYLSSEGYEFVTVSELD